MKPTAIGTCLGFLALIGLTPSALALVATTNVPSHIVTLQPGTDVDGFIAGFKLTPTVVYRHALKGFAAALDAATVERLKQDDRVRAVEPDGRIAWYGQKIGTGPSNGCNEFRFA